MSASNSNGAGPSSFQAFPHLHVDHEAGFARLSGRPLELDPPRYFGAALGSVALALNVALLVRTSCLAAEQVLLPHMEMAVDSIAEAAGQDPPQLGWKLPAFPKLKFSKEQVGLLKFETRALIVGLVELVGVVFYAVRLAILLAAVLSRSGSPRQPFRRWDAVADLFWDWLPSVRCFSAMRMLRLVHPQMLPLELLHLLKSQAGAPPTRRLLVTMGFVVTRVLILVVGIQAFLHKFVLTADRILMAEGPYSQLSVAAGFLNQLIGGVVQLDVLMQRRLLLFLFGGEDAFLDPEEAVVLRVWRARLAEALHAQAFRECGGAGSSVVHRLRCLVRWLVCMLTWSHMELQKLVLVEDPERTAKRRSRLRVLLGCDVLAKSPLLPGGGPAHGHLA